MISTAHHFIFIHAPKTGGNSVQLVLAPLSDDRLTTVNPGQDGRDRFGVTGPITPGKHATLRAYSARLGSLDGWRVIVGVREPLERAVSLYYSPHRWVDEEPWFKQRRFEKAMRRFPTVTSMLTVGEAFREPDYVLRFETLAADFAAAAEALSLPIGPLPHMNASAATADLRAEAMADPWVRNIVAGLFEVDYDRFGYVMPVHHCPTPVALSG